MEHVGTSLNSTKGRRFVAELEDRSINSFDAKSLKLYRSKKKPSWEPQEEEPGQKEMQQEAERQVPAARQTRQQTETSQTEEVELEVEPAQQQKEEPPAKPMREPPVRRPAGTGSMDGPHYSNCPKANIIPSQGEGEYLKK